MTETKFKLRKDFKKFYPVTTRWMDNDFFGHVNNVIYYSFFDTAVNRYLIESGCFKLSSNSIAFYVVKSSCNFFSSVSYPDEIEVGLVVKKIGNSSVTYGLGVFKKGYNTAAANGEFVHVFINRKENKSAPIPDNIRTSLEKLVF